MHRILSEEVFGIKIWLWGLFTVNAFIFTLFLLINHYPKLPVLINILSIVIITLWALNPKKIYFYIKKNPIDLVLIFVLFISGFILYQYKIDVITPGIQSDEISIIEAAESVSKLPEYVPFINVNYGHPTPLLYLTSVAINIFGREPFAGRVQGLLFGALSVAVFFILLRFFFSKSISFATSILMMFSYPLVVLSRLAYEITPSLFFQITTVIFIYLAYKTKDIRYFAGIGVFLGMGLFTYVGFRTFAIIVLILSLFLVLRGSKYLKKGAQEFTLILIPLFIVSASLHSYGINHFGEIMARSGALSLFGQNLPVSEILKELLGNIVRATHIFLFDGDPNLKQNPSVRSMFDIGTFLLFLIGLFYLFKKKKELFVILLVLLVAPLINDFFSLERIPEFHYYGIGHPSTLRIAGIIPIIFFAVAMALSELKSQFEKINEGMDKILIPLILIIIIIYNWISYFNQPFNLYDYKYNGAVFMNVVRTVNRSDAKEVYVSPLYLSDYRFKYFIKKDIKIKSFTPRNVEDIVKTMNSTDLIIMDSTYNRTLTSELDNYLSQPQYIKAENITNPWGFVDAVQITNLK